MRMRIGNWEMRLVNRGDKILEGEWVYALSGNWELSPAERDLAFTYFKKFAADWAKSSPSKKQWRDSVSVAFKPYAYVYSGFAVHWCDDPEVNEWGEVAP